MVNKIIKYFQLQNIGLLELLVALYSILAGYSYGPINGKVLFILIPAIISLFKKKKTIKTTWLNILIIFILLHETLLMAIISPTSYHINNTISILIVCLCIIPISRAINYTKLVGSLNWVSIISIGGLVYQAGIIISGGTVSPLKIPFMPYMDLESRLFEVGIRPTSFFWEPAALVTFLMIPLFISLTQKKYLWTGILILAMFLSTSSTGILMSLVMLIAYVLTQKISFRTRLFIVLFGASLTFALLNSSYFETGVNKIENTDPEKNARLMNGIFLYKSLDTSEKTFGIEAANVDDYYAKHGGIYFGTGNVFVPAFWLTLAKYGICGLIIFIGLYINFIVKDKTMLPYIIVLFISMFFQSISIGSSSFAYQLIFLYSYIGNRIPVRKAQLQLAL